MSEEEFKNFLNKLSLQQIHDLVRELAALNDVDIDQLIAIISR